jgi:hypothetical protein
MHEEHVISLKGVGVGLYASLLGVCQDGYSLSQTPVPGFEESEVLARINECNPLTSIDGSFKSEILKTVFNIGLRKAGEEPLWIVPNSIRYRQYSPLRRRGEGLAASGLGSPQITLHRQFASLIGKDEKEILRFANKHGLLKRYLVHDLVFRNQNTGQQFQLGESLLWWKEEIEDLAACLDLWDMILGNDKKLENIVLWHRDGITIRLGSNDVPLISRANITLLDRWSKGDTRGPALYYLSLETDKRLLNTLTMKFLPLQNSEICLVPDRLLATIWLVFLWEISGRTRLVQCASCGDYFDSQDPRARFCSARCRMRSYRKRRK